MRLFLKGLVKIMSEFRDFLDEQLEDKEFREEYEICLRNLILFEQW